MVEKFKKYDIYILLFITNAIAMILELIAARILSPCFGSSNFVWTIIIGIMLIANAGGNYFGGKLVDKYSSQKIKCILLCFSGLSTMLIAVLNNQLSAIVGGVLNKGTFEKVFTYIEVGLFLIPCAAIGALSPIINKEKLINSKNVGEKSGIIYTIITVGSLFGTLIGGLLLVPNFGCGVLLFAIAFLLCIYSFAYFSPFSTNNKVKIIFVNLIAISLFLVPFCIKKQDSSMIVVDTNESYVRIYDTSINDNPVKMFEISGGYNSANFIDPQKRDELVFEYTALYNKVLDKFPDSKDYLMIGGAGYSYPRYLISHYDDKKIDVVEIDEGITAAAKKYFYLQDFLDEYGTDRMNLITDDGRLYVQDTIKKYDVILNDAFSGNTPAKTLSTREAVEAIHSCLNDCGIYASNIILYDNYNSNNATFIGSEIKTILSSFKYVWVYKTNYGNCIVIASDYNYDFAGSSLSDFLSDDDFILTDDYAPVEALTPVLSKNY